MHTATGADSLLKIRSIEYNTYWMNASKRGGNHTILSMRRCGDSIFVFLAILWTTKHSRTVTRADFYTKTFYRQRRAYCERDTNENVVSRARHSSFKTRQQHQRKAKKTNIFAENQCDVSVNGQILGGNCTFIYNLEHTKHNHMTENWLLVRLLHFNCMLILSRYLDRRRIEERNCRNRTIWIFE